MTHDRNQPEEKLSAALRELAASSRQGASPELGLVLKGAFRTHHARRRRMQRMRVAILCICLAGFASLLLLRKPVVKNMAGQAAVHTIPPQEVSYPADTNASKASRLAPPRRTSPNRNIPTAASAFVALPSFDMVSAADELRVVRLEMPGADLRLVGAPVTEKIARGRVTADFLVGHDGTPYAVRLVQSKF
jgi:hypothetical protein